MNVILYIFRSILFRARIALGMRLLYISYKGMGRIVRLRNSSCIFGRDTQKLIEKKKDVIKPILYLINCQEYVKVVYLVDILIFRGV